MIEVTYVQPPPPRGEFVIKLDEDSAKLLGKFLGRLNIPLIFDIMKCSKESQEIYDIISVIWKGLQSVSSCHK